MDHWDSSPYALLDFERDEGAILACSARPRSDLVIEADIDVDPGVDVHPARDLAGTLVPSEEVAPDIRQLMIDLDEPLAFNPGQYVLLTLPDGETRRSYSIVSISAELYGHEELTRLATADDRLTYRSAVSRGPFDGRQGHVSDQSWCGRRGVRLDRPVSRPGQGVRQQQQPLHLARHHLRATQPEQLPRRLPAGPATRPERPGSDTASSSGPSLATRVQTVF